MKSPYSLKNIILGDIDITSLYQLHLKYPSLSVGQEYYKRMKSCNKDEFFPVIKFFSQQSVDLVFIQYRQLLFKSPVFLNALEELINCFKWNVGIIYNYLNPSQSHPVITIGLYNDNYKYPFGKYIGKPIKLNPETFNETKISLRDVVSFNTPSENIKSVTTKIFNENVSRNIKIDLLKNASATLTGCVFQYTPNVHSISSFPSILSQFEEEKNEIYPCVLYNHDLLDYETMGISPETFHNRLDIHYENVPISKSESALKLGELINMI